MNYIDVEERVRYAETDQMGVAHHSSYFLWFEIGRTEYCRRKGLPYSEIEKNGFYLMVVEVYCRYRKPLFYDQKFIIRTRLDEINGRKAKFFYELISEEGNLIAEGYSLHVATDRNGKAVTIPQDIINILTA
ncbi:MAG: acyl-CoA thioesterase [Candidatus Aminicenantia bacterium]